MPSPVQSIVMLTTPLQTGSTVLSGQWDTHNSSGTKWRKSRKLLTPAFHFSILDESIPVFQEQSNVLVSKLQSLVGEPWVDVVPLMTACTLDVICQTAMGVNIDAQGGQNSEYVRAVHQLEEAFMHRAVRPWLFPDFIFKWTAHGRSYNANIRLVKELTRKLKYPGETVPNASMITLLVQRLRDTGSVADRKRSGRAYIMKTKVANVETAIQRSLLQRERERTSVYINIITKFISLLKVMKDTLGCSKTARFVTHHGTDFFLWGYLKNVTFRNNPHAFDELKSNILHAISDIYSHALRKVSINLVKRVRLRVQENGHPFEYLRLFHHV
ncbi:cytochrome P450 4C1 [Trichonephila clavipes]|nr:cytochrome P450 4C1 [Trichonephila clavipes]